MSLSKKSVQIEMDKIHNKNLILIGVMSDLSLLKLVITSSSNFLLHSHMF